MSTRLTPQEEAEVERILAYKLPEPKDDLPGTFDFPPKASAEVEREVSRILGLDRVKK